MRRVFYYHSLEGCLETGNALSRVLPTGGEGFLYLQPVCFAMNHSDSLLLCICHGPLYLKTLSVFILWSLINHLLIACDPGYFTGVEHHPIPTLLRFFDMSV